MINFFLLLKYRYLFNPPPTPLQSSGRLAVQQMEEERSCDGCDLAAWESWAHNTLRFTLLVVPIPTTLWPCCQAWTPVLWVANPFSLRGFLLPLNSQIISTWQYPPFPAGKGLKSQSLFLPGPLARKHAVCGWAGNWEESPSRVLSALEHCTQRNDMEIDAGRLDPAVINE